MLIFIFSLIALVIVALALLEIFFIPGLGITGIASALFLAGSLYYLIDAGLFTMLALFIAGILLLFITGFVYLSRSKTIDRLSLEATVDDKAVDLPSVVVGQQGMTLSRLALSGKVRCGDTIFEATSDQGFIDEGTPITIARIERDKIYVQKAN